MQSTAKYDNPPPLINLIDDDLLTDPQVGRLLGVSPASICRYRRKGKSGVKLPWTWHGRKKVTTRACIEWWMQAVQIASRDYQGQKRPYRREIDPALERECAEAGV